MDIEAVPVDVAVDGDRARVLESKTTRILYSVRLGTSSPGEPPASQTVNTRTLRREDPLQRDCYRKSPPIILILPIIPAPQINSASHVNINGFDVKQADSPPNLTRRRLAFCGPPSNMVTVSCAIPSHDTEGTRLGRDHRLGEPKPLTDLLGFWISHHLCKPSVLDQRGSKVKIPTTCLPGRYLLAFTVPFLPISS